MIRTLRVRNLAVIEELELELGAGLNVVTGETGAGKSVLLGAISLLRGQRASSELIRSGAREASVEALLESPRVLERARRRGLAAPDEVELLVVRTIGSGRGRVHMNGHLATTALLAELLGEELEVTSQGEHQRLLSPDVQAGLLDRYAGLEPEAEALADLHRRWRRLGDALAERRAQAGELARREDRLRFEIEQIDAVEPRPGELEELEGERGRLAHVDRLAQSGAAALEELDAEGGAGDRLAAAAAQLAEAARLDPSLVRVGEALERAGLELADATRALQGYTASLEADPGRLERVEARLGELERLRARYGPTLEAILAYRDRAREELDAIGGGETRSAALEAERDEVARALGDAASRLGKARRQAAGELEAEVTREVRALQLPGARFEVRLEEWLPEGDAPSGPSGLERARFLLTANPGEGARALRDVASGGELARLSLAVRNALRDADPGRVLLFDEVDAGIGGRTARVVGERLRRLGRRHQIVCITHLPQIAALGELHYRLVKRVRGGRTGTLVERVAGQARVDEIARMAGGGRLTAATRAHARELLADG